MDGVHEVIVIDPVAPVAPVRQQSFVRELLLLLDRQLLLAHLAWRQLTGLAQVRQAVQGQARRRHVDQEQVL